MCLLLLVEIFQCYTYMYIWCRYKYIEIYREGEKEERDNAVYTRFLSYILNVNDCLIMFMFLLECKSAIVQDG